MGRILVWLVLAGLALFSYLQGVPSLAILFGVVLLCSLLELRLRLMAGVLRRLESVPQEHDANSVLIYTFGLGRIFEHPAVDRLFASLQRQQKAPAPTLEAWRSLLAENYKRKHKRNDLVCEVRFNIKNNLLFVNGEVEFGDHVYYVLEVPYRWKDTGDPDEGSFAVPGIEAKLSVRVLLLNGTLLLQVGEFSKEYSPKILRGGSLAAYETFATITTFPLMYFALQHGIPARYLNLIPQATPSYKAGLSERGRAGKAKIDQYSDWRELTREVAAYRVLCGSGDEEAAHEAVLKIERTFTEKRERLVAAEKYETSKDDSEGWRYPDTGTSYWNKYGTVFFQNMNANRESRHEARWFADYYEEEP